MRQWSAVPVIALSACSQESDKIAALDAGADDYLSSRLHSANCSGCASHYAATPPPPMTTPFCWRNSSDVTVD
ncbi:hypothetical protein ACNKHM_03420 [Shigella sonnei]